MLQIIGLIVAVYGMNATMFRVLQMHATESDKFFGLPASSRLILAALMAGVTVAILAFLTLALMMSSVDLGDT